MEDVMTAAVLVVIFFFVGKWAVSWLLSGRKDDDA